MLRLCTSKQVDLLCSPLRQIEVKVARDKMLLETPGDDEAAGTHVQAAPASSLAEQQFGSIEELVEASGMLQDKPPLENGESGHSFYTTQVRHCWPAASVRLRMDKHGRACT